MFICPVYIHSFFHSLNQFVFIGLEPHVWHVLGARALSVTSQPSPGSAPSWCTAQVLRGKVDDRQAKETFWITEVLQGEGQGGVTGQPGPSPGM